MVDPHMTELIIVSLLFMVGGGVVVWLALCGSDKKVLLWRLLAAIAMGSAAIAISWDRPATAAVWLAVAWMVWP